MSYTFARHPRWILMHSVILVMVSLFALAGFWQLWRLDQRRADNELVRSRRDMPPVRSVADGDLAHRRARLTGRYDVAEEVVLTGRGSRGRSGNHLLTPLRLGPDEAVLVDRGWVPSDTPPGAAEAPGGRVVVEGFLLPAEGRGPFGSGSGETDRISRIDVERIDGQISYDLAPLYLLLREQRPPQPGDIPFPADLTAIREGSHLSYAVQWFSFIPIALVVYGVILRREATKRSTTLPSP